MYGSPGRRTETAVGLITRGHQALNVIRLGQQFITCGRLVAAGTAGPRPVRLILDTERALVPRPYFAGG